MPEEPAREVLPTANSDLIKKGGKGMVSIDTGQPIVFAPPSEPSTSSPSSATSSAASEGEAE
jgi:hypothetical protein